MGKSNRYTGRGCSEDPDVKGTETTQIADHLAKVAGCSEDPDVKGTETSPPTAKYPLATVAARIPM